VLVVLTPNLRAEQAGEEVGDVYQFAQELSAYCPCTLSADIHDKPVFVVLSTKVKSFASPEEPEGSCDLHPRRLIDEYLRNFLMSLLLSPVQHIVWDRALNVFFCIYYTDFVNNFTISLLF
jgi:hypothetical protein